MAKTRFFRMPERTRVKTANMRGKFDLCVVAEEGFFCLLWARLNQQSDKMADRKKLVRTFMAKSEDFNCSSDSSLGLDDASSDEYHPSLSDESSGGKLRN